MTADCCCPRCDPDTYPPGYALPPKMVQWCEWQNGGALDPVQVDGIRLALGYFAAEALPPYQGESAYYRNQERLLSELQSLGDNMTTTESTVAVGDIVRVRIGFGRPPLAEVSKVYANGKDVKVTFRSAKMIEAYGKAVKVGLSQVSRVEA